MDASVEPTAAVAPAAATANKTVVTIVLWKSNILMLCYAMLCYAMLL